MRKIKDRKGKRYGRLLVIELYEIKREATEEIKCTGNANVIAAMRKSYLAQALKVEQQKAVDVTEMNK